MRKFIDSLLFILIASMSWQVIPAWFPPFRKGWMLLGLIAILLVISRGKTISKTVIAPLSLFSIVLIINAFMGDQYIGSIPNALFEILVLFIPPAITMRIISNNSIKLYNKLFTFIVLSLLISAIASTVILQVDAGVIRNLYQMTQEQGDLEVMYSFYKYGLFDYDTAHALPILIPPLVYLFKHSSSYIFKYFSFFLIILCFWLSVLAEATTPLLLELLMLIMSFLLGGVMSRRKFVGLLAFSLVIVVLLAFPSIVNGVFKSIGDLLGADSPITVRMEEINSVAKDGNASNTSDIDSRMAHYNETMQLIMSNVLTGSNKSPGNHSVFLDHFAAFGLVGLIPFILYLIGQVKVMLRYIALQKRLVIVESAICAFLILFLKGMFVWPIFFYLYTIVPLMMFADDSRDRYK